MQINLSGHHVDITPSLRAYVSNKLKRLARHSDCITDTHVVLTVEKLVRKAEAQVHVTGDNLYAEAESHDMYASIDALADKLDRQVKRHKEKLNDHHRTEVPPAPDPD